MARKPADKVYSVIKGVDVIVFSLNCHTGHARMRASCEVQLEDKRLTD